MDKDLERLRRIYWLKSVYRMNSVGNRKESSAEHSWSCLVLADYFLNKMKIKVDRTKVYEMLIYHDVVEIESGDVPIHHEDKRIDKHWSERKAAAKLKKDLPKNIGTKFAGLFEEFEERKTKEARFAKAIDKLDATLHEMDYKKDWKGWTEKTVRRYNDKYFEDFPEIRKANDEIIEYATKNGYFDQ